MKNLPLGIAISILFISFSACTSSPNKNAESSVKTFMKVNLKSENNYEPISFSAIDTLLPPDTMTNNRISYFKLTHTYKVKNENAEVKTMSIDFYLDQDLRVNGANSSDLIGNE